MAESHYDIIIAGGGAAGLSLVYGLVQAGITDKKILMIDKVSKEKNDRTWCFWEKEEGPFESIVCKSWKKVWFHSDIYSSSLNLSPYQYKMIRGIDYYQFIRDKISGYRHIQQILAEVKLIDHSPGYATVQTSQGDFTADYVFSSIYDDTTLKKFRSGNVFLLQHFLGWFIQTPDDYFNVEEAILMDFRVPQNEDTCFCYLLPIDTRHALIEFTVFSEEVWPEEKYLAGLTDYIHNYLPGCPYQIMSSEFGVIPMYDYSFPQKKGNRIFYIGTAGGNTKASTGYTFTRIHKNTDRIIRAWMKKGRPDSKFPWWRKRFEIYDSALLNVLSHRWYPGYRIFVDLFSKNKPQRVLSFLNESTTIFQELAIMNSVPAWTFLKGMIRAFKTKLKGNR